MTPLPVVKHLDVFAYCAFRLCPCREVPMVNQLCLQAPPEALHRGVVEAISFSRHRYPETKLIQYRLVVLGTILPAAIRMMDSSCSRTMLLYGSEQRSSRQFRLHPVPHRITDDLAREHVLDPGQIKPALASGEWSERPAVVELFAGLSSPNRTCTFQRIRLSI